MDGFNLRWDFGSITYVKIDADGVLKMKVDSYGVGTDGITSVPGGPLGEALTPYGIFASPPEPSSTPLGEIDLSRSCQALYCWEGSQLHVLPLGDPRDLALIPRQPAGSSGRYCNAGSWDVMDGKTGSYFMYVPYAFDGRAVRGGNPRGTAKKTMSIEVNVETAGAESMNLIHGEGNAIMLGADGCVTLKNPKGDAFISVGPQGITLNGQVRLVGGLSAGNVEGAQPVALAPTVVAKIEAIEVLLEVMSAGILAISTAVVSGPPTTPAEIAFAPLLTALSTELEFQIGAIKAIVTEEIVAKNTTGS